MTAAAVDYSRNDFAYGSNDRRSDRQHIYPERVVQPAGPRLGKLWLAPAGMQLPRVFWLFLICRQVHFVWSLLVAQHGQLRTLFELSCGSVGSAAAQEGFKTYSNKSDRYHIEYPVAWKETSKSGASILLQDPDRKSTTVGVTVTPVRIAKLEDIGDPAAVAEKLIAAEKAKVCVSDARGCAACQAHSVSDRQLTRYQPMIWSQSWPC